MPVLPNIPSPGAGGSVFGSVAPKVQAAHKVGEEDETPNPAEALMMRYISMGTSLFGGPEGGSLGKILEKVSKDARRFEAEFAAVPTAPTPFLAFAKHYYAAPRPEMLVPAFVSLLRDQDGLAGDQQMFEAMFFGRALGQLGPAGMTLGVLMTMIVDEVNRVMLLRATGDRQRAEATRIIAARREGVLQVLLLADDEALCNVVEQSVENSARMIHFLETSPEAETATGEDGQPMSPAERAGTLAAARELHRRQQVMLPPQKEQRAPVRSVTWPLPGLSYEDSAFFDGLLSDSTVPWARSSSLITIATTARDRAGEDGTGLSAEVWARVGRAVGEQIQDAMWAEVYAVGDVMAVRKCLAAANEWFPFLDEFGPDHILDPEHTPVPARFRWPEDDDPEEAARPEDDPADPRERMRFHLAKRAMARLVREASLHPLVVEVAELERRDLMHLAATAASAEVRDSALVTVSANARQAARALESMRPLLHMVLAETRQDLPALAGVFAQQLGQNFGDLATEVAERARQRAQEGKAAAAAAAEDAKRGRGASKQVPRGHRQDDSAAGGDQPGDEGEAPWEDDSAEPLMGAETGVVPPGALLALGWELPPMLREIWEGRSPVSDLLRAKQVLSDDEVLEGVDRFSQRGRSGFCVPVLRELPKDVAKLSPRQEEAEAVAAVAEATDGGAVRVAWDQVPVRGDVPTLTCKVAHEMFDLTRRVREHEAGGGKAVLRQSKPKSDSHDLLREAMRRIQEEGDSSTVSPADATTQPERA